MNKAQRIKQTVLCQFAQHAHELKGFNAGFLPLNLSIFIADVYNYNIYINPLATDMAE